MKLHELPSFLLQKNLERIPNHSPPPHFLGNSLSSATNNKEEIKTLHLATYQQLGKMGVQNAAALPAMRTNPKVRVTI